MNTHESYVSLEVAELLKEAGFDWEIDTLYFPYHKNKNEVNQRSVPRNWNSKNADEDGYMTISAPSLDVAQRWLREVKGFEVTIDWSVIVNANLVDFNERVYNYHIESDDYADGDNEFTSYEEAQEAGIKKALEIILEKGDAR